MDRFNNTLTRIRRLLAAQRLARLALRLTWLVAGGYLAALGLDAAFGWFPSSGSRWALGALIALPFLLAALQPLRNGRIAWRIDRLLGLREQVSAALRIAGTRAPANRIEQALLEESGEKLSGVRERVARRGWHLRPELESLLAVLVLAAAVTLSANAGIPFSVPETEPVAVPSLDQPPGFEDVFPSGIPGLAGPSGGDGNPAQAGEAPSESELQALDNILSDLGKALSEYPETAEAGEALQNGDLEGAAAAIERTADRVDLLPEDARQNLRQALQQAAAQARDAGQDDLAGDLEAAAQALQNPDPNNPMAADALDDLADGLRELGEAFAAMGTGESDGSAPPENEPQVGSAGGASGSGSGAGTDGPPEPISRLEGAGEDFTIEGGDTPSGLLQPGSSPGQSTTGSGASTSAGGSGGSGSAGIADSVLTPYSFPWEWRDVVSEYFSP